MAIRAKIERAAALQTDEDALDSIELFAHWSSMIGKVLHTGERYQCDGYLWKVLQDHTAQADWRPDVSPSLFVKVSIEECPEWVQPTGATDSYNIGDKVSHNGKHWQSLVDGNVWEPSEDVPTLWQLVVVA